MREYFRRLPKVDVLLKDERIQALCEDYGRGFVVECIRQELERVRAMIVACNADVSEVEKCLTDFPALVEKKVLLESEYPLKKVINATGIILHTNLGRAPLGKIHLDAMEQAMCGYSNLEYDLDTGKRGKRWTHYADLIAKVTGAEGAIAVNNNAASLTLIFSALAEGKEVIVSRGESIEIGGRFRIPEVVEQSGAKLREVGTTNRTRISDYEKAIHENTAALLKVHTSNYKIVGFTEEATLEELSELGAKYHLPVIMDLGSGVLVNLEKYGLAHEPTVQETLRKGADLVCFSGDKLLGGPQAGIIVGKKKLIQEMEHYPLMRAIRLDKCLIAALSVTFREYLDEERAMKNIPVMRMIARNCEELEQQATRLVERLGFFEKTDSRRELQSKNRLELKSGVVENADKNLLGNLTSIAEIQVEPSISMVGGGSLPGESLVSYAVTIQPRTMTCEAMMQKMRKFPVPVIAHVKNDKIWLDMRTIMPEEIEVLVEELNYIR